MAQSTNQPAMESLSPVIIVDEVEPCVPFWRDRLGFQLVAEVPHEGKMGFAMLVSGGVTIMYQSHASAEADITGVAPPSERSRTPLYINVENLDDLAAHLDEDQVVVPRRTTFYGAEEIWVRGPCGSLIGFARQPERE